MKITNCAVVVLSVVILAFGQKPQDSKLLAPGTPAPSFSLPTLSGDRMSLSIYCGETLSKPFFNKTRHTMILSFWATYCKPCQKEIPELISFADKHKTDNIVVLCVSIDKEGATVVEPFVKEKNYTVQVLLDPYTKTAERYGVKSLPALFVIDTMGVIRYSSLGYDEKSPLSPKLESIVKAIKEGTKIKIPDATGSFVPIQEEPAPTAAAMVAAPTAASAKTEGEPKKPSATPGAKQKWNAIARVECGEQIDKVAASIGATPAELHQWYADLKKAELSVWGADSAAH
jgi:cytochrome c biogenesis protein CcmG, thiol:disulfide interchange protein DsbE